MRLASGLPLKQNSEAVIKQQIFDKYTSEVSIVYGNFLDLINLYIRLLATR